MLHSVMFTWNKLNLVIIQTDIKVGNHIARMRKNPFESCQFATGGNENVLKLWDLNKPEQPLFKAKNVSMAKYWTSSSHEHPNCGLWKNNYSLNPYGVAGSTLPLTHKIVWQ